MEATTKSLIFFHFLILLLLLSPSFNLVLASSKKLPSVNTKSHHYHRSLRRLDALKASIASPLPPPSSPPPEGGSDPRIYLVTSYGADPTGQVDSTEALLAAMADAVNGSNYKGYMMMQGITNVGGAQINLQGGNYLISRPLRLPVTGVGNLQIHGGTIRASDTFPSDGYLIDLSPTNDKTSSSSPYNYEYITFKDLLLDSNFKGGGISVINSLRIGIDNCYITHFTTNGILVQSGHETYIRNTFIGQHITAGGDKGEREFSGTGITLQGNDNAVTDVVIFSGAIGIMVTGQANIISGVHCYNKASGFGGTGIYLRLPSLTQTRIVNSYMDYTSIVAEDPFQLHISSTFFLGDANIVLKSIKGVVSGINIVDNIFSGSNSGVEIVHLDQSKGGFENVEQVFVDRNVAKGMNMKSTIGRVSLQGNGTSSWVVDFNEVLLFPNLIKHVQYSLSIAAGDGFPGHVLRNVSDNRVVIETSEAVTGNLYVEVDQGR
ncbi:polygalacturonase QRT3 [Senna tora]|uniref:Polygalacturonase QRT3 n=1 Tax=Senna tora TaxID=362788 RepID=A0A834SDE3_9FABA|nr:polygalacturonase QRT3 [Senna tora]